MTSKKILFTGGNGFIGRQIIPFIQKAGYEVSLFPWLPLTPETKIPVAADWLITMVEPTAKLKEMYVEDVVNYGKDDKNTGTVQ